MSSPDVRGNKGFTLLEMMIAIAIAGILMLTAIPAMKNWKAEHDLAAKVEAVIAELDMARISAQQINRMVSIMPNDDTGNRSWRRGFYVYVNAQFAKGRGDLDNTPEVRARDILSTFDVSDAQPQLMFAVDATGQGNANDLNIRFMPNGMSGLVGDGQADLTTVRGDVNIRLCRVIGDRAITWTITMRTSGDITKNLQSVDNGECQGF